MPDVRTDVRIETEALRAMWGEDGWPTTHEVKNPPGEWRQEADGIWRFYRKED